ncbi:MAG: hypothetical protein IIW40_06065 [Clostridia bacterium]|nr:hypothetical protein [Clostridia bacterium]
MRKAYKTCLALLAVVWLLGCLLPFTTTAAPSIERYGRSVLQRMDKSGRLAEAYDVLADGAVKAQGAIAMPTGNKAITQDELAKVFDAFYSDHPECFWINGGFSMKLQGGAVQSVTPNNSFKETTFSKAKQAFDSRTAELIKGLSGKSDYDKAKLLHDRLAAVVEYQPTSNDQNAYGALVEGKAVCTGYARSYQHLLQQVGISAWLVSGRSVSPTTGKVENHAWTAAKLDGDWYYTDVTWDDQGEDLFYAYFDLNGKQMAEDHVADTFADYLPQANATADNYFVHNNGIITGFDADKLAKLLKEGNMTARVYVNGDKGNFEAALRDESTMRKVLAKLGYGSNVGYSWSEKTLGHEVILTIHVDGDPTTQKGNATTTTKEKGTAATTVKGKPTTSKAGGGKGTAVRPDASTDTTTTALEEGTAVSEEGAPVTNAPSSVPEEEDAVSYEDTAGDSVSRADSEKRSGNNVVTIIVLAAAVVVAGGAAGLVLALRRR